MPLEMLPGCGQEEGSMGLSLGVPAGMSISGSAAVSGQCIHSLSPSFMDRVAEAMGNGLHGVDF